MTQINSLSAPPDLDTEKRRALAKVYRLLIRLAEEAEKDTTNTQDTEKAKGANLETSTDGTLAL
jgi:hypothetical protein